MFGKFKKNELLAWKILQISISLQTLSMTTFHESHECLCFTNII